jgi:hypothetical protein
VGRTFFPLLALGIASATTPAYATSDSQFWATTAVNAKLADKWGLSEEVVTRFSDNRNGLYEIEATTLVGYRFNKTISLWAGYVHDPQYSAGEFRVMEHRAREQLVFDSFARIGGGKLTGRVRLEQRWREGVNGTGLRLRPYLKYSLPIHGKTALNLSTEPFFNLNTTSYQATHGLDRVRNLITISTPIAGRLAGEAGYMNQHIFVPHGEEDESDNIAYLTLNFSF